MLNNYFQFCTELRDKSTVDLYEDNFMIDYLNTVERNSHFNNYTNTPHTTIG